MICFGILGTYPLLCGEAMIPLTGHHHLEKRSHWRGTLLQVDRTDWTAILSADDGIRLQRGASIDDLHACETALGSPLPSELRRLYLVSDGVWDERGQWFAIWPLADVAQRNGLANEVEGPARSLWIGFGDDGTGSP